MVILLLVGGFVIASSTSISSACVLPVLRMLTPPRYGQLFLPAPRQLVRQIAPLPLLPTLSYAISLVICVFWFVHRRAPWAWALQVSLSHVC